MISDAQGLVVIFDSVTAENVISCQVAGGEASLIESTPLTAPVLGSGVSARCAKQVQAGSVEPTTVSITMLSPGLAVSTADRGKVGFLSVNNDVVSYSGQAVLLSTATAMSAGELPQQTVTFSYLS